MADEDHKYPPRIQLRPREEFPEPNVSLITTEHDQILDVFYIFWTRNIIKIILFFGGQIRRRARVVSHCI